MRLTTAACLLLIVSFLLTGPATAQQTGAPSADDAIARIRDEGLNRSKVLETLSYLSDVIGPRLTNSPQFRRAAAWTRDRLASWGLQNARLEAWGPFGRGWEIKRFSAEVVEPQAIPLIAYPKAWSPGTNGPVVSEVVYVDAQDEAGLEKFKGQLKGKIVLTGAVREVKARFKPVATRWTEEEMLNATTDAPFPPTNPAFSSQPSEAELAEARFAARRRAFAAGEAPALIVEPSSEWDGGTILVQGAFVPPPAAGGRRMRPWDKDVTGVVPQVVVSVEHFNRLARMIRAGERVRMAVNLDVRFYDEDLMCTNTVAEIPGTDLKDELVVIGAHLDSWHAGTGATDNGAGVAVMMEAARIIQAAGLKPRRTIRVALWGGEEQGAQGSRTHVEQNFAKLGPPVVPGPGFDKLSAYFNVDAGTGRVRGVFLHGNEALRPVFRPWLERFRDTGATALTLNSDWGSDFVWFEQAGIPVVNFIQDDVEYETRTHHSNQDVFDRIQPDDLKQAATIVAAFVYQTAMRDERLPRKPAK
jgi:hypothetical protein